MQRNGKGRSAGWPIEFIPFQTVIGSGWRLHMSKVAAEIRSAGFVGCGARSPAPAHPVKMVKEVTV